MVVTDGRASFAIFIYQEGGMDIIDSFRDNLMIGFDGGDQIRGATVHSPGFSSLQDLEEVNIFRIDGKTLPRFE